MYFRFFKNVDLLVCGNIRGHFKHRNMGKEAFCYDRQALMNTGIYLTIPVVNGVYPLTLLNSSN